MAQTTITQTTPINQQNQILDISDSILVTSISTDSSFNVETDSIEGWVYDLNNTLIQSVNVSYTVQNTNVDNNEIKELFIDPVRDLEVNILNTGIYNINYNFLRNKLDSSVFSQYYISEISNDRTELRLDTTNLTNDEIKISFDNFSIDFNNSPVFNGFYLNFNSNNLLLATNIALDTTDGKNTILIKLYEPLPPTYDIKTQLWVVEKVSDPLAYQVEFINDQVEFDDRIFLKGPNFNISVKDQVNNSTEFKTLTTLSSNSTGLQNQLNSLLAERRVELNTDYTDFNNFIFFSSAEQRLSNFYYKASLIESYNNDITVLDTLPNTIQVSSSKAIIQSKINDIITKFDGYDYFLYYDSGSKSWPKSTPTKPYTLYSTGSAQVITWYNEQSLSSSRYDNENQNYLYNVLPQYIQEDPDNDQFQLFVDMVAQLFDEIWLYTQAIKNRQDGDNSLSGGISKDLVADALRSYGINIYQSSFSTSDLFTSYLGITSNGSLLPPTGSEVITNYVTSSAEMIPFDDAQKLIYKRLYHNLPYLLKKKGTIDGLRTLLTCFGVPSTIIQTVEFGGKNTTNTNDWDYFEDRFDYAYSSTGSQFISSSFALNSSWNSPDDVPSAVAFRFKAESVPPTNYSQSLWSTDKGLGIYLEYNGSNLITGSYSGSSTNPYNQYGTLKFISGTDSASIYLPFFNEGWWSILINSSSIGYTLYAKNNIYDGYEGNKIGFQSSSSLAIPTLWSASAISYFASSSGTYIGFSGSLQELRYYTQPLPESSFNDFVMNHYSIESSNTLSFRAALGSQLYTSSVSIHPKVDGSWVTTSSFISDSDFYFSSTPTFSPNVETLYYDEPGVGLLNRVSNKIKLQDNNIPSGDVLSPLASLSQVTPSIGSISHNNNLLEVGFSPQNEIDKDIIEQLGYFNIGEYIGDPRQISNKSYNDLSSLRNEYFQKYDSPYNYSDYVRLIKYFDNALFKMIKDFVPARTSISTGIIIKPTILERPKYPEPQVSWTRPEYTASIEHHSGSNTIYLFSGDNGGLYFNQSSSFTESFSGPTGIFNIIHNDNAEFYNGELEGTVLTVTTQSLLNNPLLDDSYRESIADLQNLNASSNLSLTGAGSFTEKIPFNIESPDVLYYNNSTYEYSPKFSIIGDIIIYVSASYTGSVSGTEQNLYIQFQENGKIIGESFILNQQGTAGLVSGSFSQNLLIPGSQIKSGNTYTANLSARGSGIYLPFTSSFNTSSYWKINVSNTFAQSIYYTDPTVYTQQNFPGNINEFDDYYAIYGNVYSNRISNKYFDVDYSSNPNIPVNFTSIMSSSAIYAQVQPSNYTLRRHINSRYEGSKLYGANINQFTVNDTSYANKPVIERYADYVAQYDYVDQGNSTSVIHILSLVDIEGNKIALNGNTNYNFGMIKTLFPQSSSISLVDLTSNSAGLNTSGSARISASLDENNMEIYGSITKTDTGFVVPSNFNPYVDIYEVARKAGLI
jgi:hypothetical protein